MMESLLLSGKGLKTLDPVESDFKNKSKTVAHIDLSNNYLT